MRLLYECLRIRMVEEKIIELYPSDLIQSPVHLSIGQEAVAVGICDQLQDEDWVFINYRGHAFYLAKGGRLDSFFAELMGRVTGISKGKAGSMHLAAPEKGVMGASAVVASSISHAVGAALAAKIKGQRSDIYVANFGDGATEQGVLHECLNFASLHALPVLFLCEDNGLAVHTSIPDRQSYELEHLVKSYNMPFVSIDEGYDPVQVSGQAEGCIGYVRKERRPLFLKVRACRYREHVGPGEDFDGGYRDEKSVQAWKKLDPLILFERELDELKSQILKEIDEAVSFAVHSPFPGLEELLTDVI
jgi:TPP-dependent pyruvate/acetoin dehydrogenase alpha subunit